jgi:CheY-like chemotaxis protein
VAVDLRRHVAAERQRRQSFAMDAVGRLAGAVAHDFNNLLTGIRGSAQLALDDLVADSPLRSDLDEIVQSADRAAVLTSRLLAFGRRQVLRPRVIDPVELVRSSEIALRRAAGTDNELVLQLSPTVGSVNVDPGQLERVLIDLVAHARAVMRARGEIRIAVSGVKLDAADARALVDVHAGDFVTIDVTDSGAPLGADTLEHLFEPAPVGRTGVDPGLGLGTAYGVIRQSEGVITAESGSERGTTLRVWLPRVNAPPEAATQTAPATVSVIGTETLLLVEDEATVRQLARKVLVRNGYTVLEAGDGVEALEVFRAHAAQIALVVTDIIMPSMGGPELVRRLRALRPDLRVLLMSGYTDDATLRRGFSRQDEAFLEKPFTPAALAQRVRSLLDAGSGSARRGITEYGQQQHDV